MAAKRLLFGKTARARLLAGARVLAGAVEPTLGPSGRTVLLERPMWRTPLATKDGVTVAEEVELADAFENMGAQLVLESAVKTSSVAGDGTTTATVLAHAIYREGVRLVAAGHHPIDLKRGIDRATERVIAALGKMSKPIAGNKDIARVATISANGDASVGKLIALAVGKVGQEGIIHVEQGTALETKLEVAEGVEIDRGFLSPYFITDKERLVVELDQPYLLLSAQTGGGVVAEEPGVTLGGVRVEDLGRAQRIVVNQEKTTILGGAGRKTDVAARAREIRALREATASTYRHQELDERLRRLVGGAAVIRVGGTTDPETREKKARIDDALFATRAAIQEGIVVGGGLALLRASQALAKVDRGLSGGEAAGVALVRRACEAPCRQIAKNAGAAGT
ncbi:MAG: TCP-1/cpn60 chaperonin family protein, partial [Pseudomonadota bacterium]